MKIVAPSTTTRENEPSTSSFPVTETLTFLVTKYEDTIFDEIEGSAEDIANIVKTDKTEQTEEISTNFIATTNQPKTSKLRDAETIFTGSLSEDILAGFGDIFGSEEILESSLESSTPTQASTEALQNQSENDPSSIRDEPNSGRNIAEILNDLSEISDDIRETSEIATTTSTTFQSTSSTTMSTVSANLLSTESKTESSIVTTTTKTLTEIPSDLTTSTVRPNTSEKPSVITNSPILKTSSILTTSMRPETSKTESRSLAPFTPPPMATESSFYQQPVEVNRFDPGPNRNFGQLNSAIRPFRNLTPRPLVTVPPTVSSTTKNGPSIESDGNKVIEYKQMETGKKFELGRTSGGNYQEQSAIESKPKLFIEKPDNSAPNWLPMVRKRSF